jgi:predicted O-linked N-acetylglucosamine transferase (SPINDLY family)
MSPQQIHRAMQQAVAHHQAGRFDVAEQTYREVLKSDKRNADALHLLGVIALQAKREQEAADLINKAIMIRPQAEFFINLSQAYKGLGRLAECVSACRRAVQLNPNVPEAWNNLGSALKDQNQPAEAVAAFERAIQLRPTYASAFNNLGNALSQLERFAEAERAFRRSLELNPNDHSTWSNLGFMLGSNGRLDEAVALCTRAIQIKPDFVAGYMNLGTAYHQQGKLDEGNNAYRRGAAIDPNHARLHENLLGAFTQTTRWTPAEMLDAHMTWARKFATPPKPLPPPANDRNPDRKLRIGYVSPDFRTHSVAYFIEPILEQHDRSAFEITLYAHVESPDHVTERLKKKCDRWRDVVSLSEEQLAQTIRNDRIDVLVDLAGHTQGNRLIAFGYKPAPVQMTYLGYALTTGIEAIDYRLTDDVTDPPGMTESHYSEKLIRLPAPFLCYRPPENSPPPVDPPVLSKGYITFGSFNRAPKAGPETIPLWAKLLAAVPNARLMLKSRGFGDEGSRRRILDGFAGCGIDPRRIDLVEANQKLPEHLAMYGQVDIAVDTFPYHGTTTTCEALWMGVPVVSLIGRTHVSRVGLSLLQAVELGELAGETPDAYIKLATDLANDSDRLTRLRRETRQRLVASPLCDAKRLTKAIEGAIRDSFAEWCR